MDTLLTLEDVAQTLKAALPIVRALIARGELAALEIAPGEFRIPPGDLRRFINVRKRNFSGGGGGRAA